LKQIDFDGAFECSLSVVIGARRPRTFEIGEVQAGSFARTMKMTLVK
jgi:hypothetical protein